MHTQSEDQFSKVVLFTELWHKKIPVHLEIYTISPKM